MKTLVIAEKESQALDLSKGLEKYGSFKLNKPGRYFESNKYIITWAQGHILGLKEPRDSENWGDRKWELEALPWYPPNNKFEYKVTNERIYNQLKAIFQRSDINEIIVSTDAGREGTLIAQELIDHFEFKGPVKRFYESAVLSPENIQRIIENDLKGQDFIVPRVKAAYARSFADLLLGMNFSIGFSAKAGATLSMGRVKTPVMAILAQRKKEIMNFKEETYFELEAEFGGVYKGLWFKEQLSNTKFGKPEEIQAMIAKISGKDGVIVKKEVKKVPENPKLLYSLTTLQREASKKFGFDPDRTLEIAQSLYDTHKMLSYPRTESEVIGTGHVKDLPAILNAINVDVYSSHVQYILSNEIPTNKRMVNDKKLSDHHAIIPTNIAPKLSALNGDERKVYDLVVKRFLSAFYPAAMYEKTEVITEVEGETFKTSGRIEVDKGWKVVYGSDVEDGDDDSEDATIPPIEQGESRVVSTTKEISKKTSPPKLYDYDSLLAIMVNPKRLLATDELKEALDSAEAPAGLGTVATRGEIIKELLNREYIIKKGKSLDISDFGMLMIEVCPEKLKSPEITAEWEGKLRKMELNEYEFDVFMDELHSYIESILDELRVTQWSVMFPRKNGGEEVATCPHCGTGIKNIGKVYVCGTSTPEDTCFIVATEIGKKKIASSSIKELAENGETKLIKGFTSNKGKKFDAKLKLEGKKLSFSFDKDEIAICPYCQTSVTDKGKVYSCTTNSIETPCFVVFKEIAKKQIPISAVKQLAEKGVTNEIKGFTGSKGKFDAKLKLEDKKVSFAFDVKTKSENKATNLKCPFCQKGEIKENAKAFGCNNWKEGCKFTVWKNGDKITVKIVEKLIKDGESGRIDGLRYPNGSYFNANLKLDLNKKVINTEQIND